jgi:hypothetical protein
MRLIANSTITENRAIIFPGQVFEADNARARFLIRVGLAVKCRDAAAVAAAVKLPAQKKRTPKNPVRDDG